MQSWKIAERDQNEFALTNPSWHHEEKLNGKEYEQKLTYVE